jgi:hypothetical protein
MSSPVQLPRSQYQNWLITPAALAVGEQPPKNIHDQRWLLVLSGVVTANFQGNSTSQWRHETVTYLPDMGDTNTGVGPINWAIQHYSIPTPPPNTTYGQVFSLDDRAWAPFVVPCATYDAHESIDAGYGVNSWRPTHFDNGVDALTGVPVINIFTGVTADIEVRDTDATILSLAYNVALVGRIAFTKRSVMN